MNVQVCQNSDTIKREHTHTHIIKGGDYMLYFNKTDLKSKKKKERRNKERKNPRLLNLFKDIYLHEPLNGPGS